MYFRILTNISCPFYPIDAKAFAMFKNEKFLSTLFLLLAFFLILLDVYEDLESGASYGHIIEEGCIALLILAGIGFLWKKYLINKKGNVRLQQELKVLQQDLQQYKESSRDFTLGLSQKIDEQFSKWKLTSAEKEVALFLLKGLSNKEISELRQTKEKTVREQTSSLYRKSNLGSQRELFSFFLEDLLVIK